MKIKEMQVRLIFGSVTVLLSIMASAPAGAATIPVTTLGDDEVGNGNCTLREAIRAANDNLAVDGCPAGDDDNDTVELYGLSGTIALGSGLPIITGPLTLRGPGARILVIDARGTDRVLQVGNPGGGPPLSVSGLTLTGGLTPGVGGGIFNHGVLTLRDCVIEGNSAELGGGGVFNLQGVLTIADSAISNNNTGGNGGGMNSFEGVTSIEGSTIDGNEVLGLGGGIFAEGLMTITNTTISENSGGHSGGGLYVWSNTVTINHGTIVDNTGPVRGDGIFVMDQGRVELRNTILSGPVQTCTILNIGQGVINSLGGNLEDSNTCFLDQPDDLADTDPLLGPLRLNGGPTATHALLPGSPAIDSAGAALVPATDQRGLSRPAGAGPDRGAFEYGVMPAPAGATFIAYGETARPVLNTDAQQARPLAVGEITSGFVRVLVDLLPSAVSTDLYLGLALPGVENDIVLIASDLSFTLASQQVVPWKTAHTEGVYEDVFGAIPVGALPAGTYSLYLLRQEAGGDFSTYDLWMTSFDLP